MKPAVAAGLAVGCWLSVAGAAACRDAPAAVGSCSDDLSGVWSDGERRWHALDLWRSVEIYPMFDSAETAEDSAHSLVFVRSPEGLRGHELSWSSGAERLTRARHPATIECADGRLEIAYQGRRLHLRRP